MNNYYLFTQAIETFEKVVKAESEEEAERLFYANIRKYYGEGMANACVGATTRKLSSEESLNFKGYWDEPVEWLEGEKQWNQKNLLTQLKKIYKKFMPKILKM
jgi:hypothetical protein|tara:strand:+ start:838 stop:1146 length:309 start_codon:yes stop_codon:yes gene_type:complete